MMPASTTFLIANPCSAAYVAGASIRPSPCPIETILEGMLSQGGTGAIVRLRAALLDGEAQDVPGDVWSSVWTSLESYLQRFPPFMVVARGEWVVETLTMDLQNRRAVSVLHRACKRIAAAYECARVQAEECASLYARVSDDPENMTVMWRMIALVFELMRQKEQHHAIHFFTPGGLDMGDGPPLALGLGVRFLKTPSGATGFEHN